MGPRIKWSKTGLEKLHRMTFFCTLEVKKNIFIIKIKFLTSIWLCKCWLSLLLVSSEVDISPIKITLRIK